MDHGFLHTSAAPSSCAGCKNAFYPPHDQNQNHGFSFWFQFPFSALLQGKVVLVSGKWFSFLVTVRAEIATELILERAGPVYFNTFSGIKGFQTDSSNFSSAKRKA